MDQVERGGLVLAADGSHGAQAGASGADIVDVRPGKPPATRQILLTQGEYVHLVALREAPHQGEQCRYHAIFTAGIDPTRYYQAELHSSPRSGTRHGTAWYAMRQLTAEDRPSTSWRWLRSVAINCSQRICSECSASVESEAAPERCRSVT